MERLEIKDARLPVQLQVMWWRLVSSWKLVEIFVWIWIYCKIFAWTWRNKWAWSYVSIFAVYDLWSVDYIWIIWRRGIIGLPAVWRVNSSEQMEFWSFFRVWKHWQNDFSMFAIIWDQIFLFSVHIFIGNVMIIGDNNIQMFMRTNIVWMLS